ncbi:MAG: helix-turn-helix transcriptional regulator [Firmicutes bacterium]|nr:helix-turn-helix transcriptional regulator [Bacillota bacterium]
MKLALAENIRAFRKQRKLTQEKLAEVLGVTVGAVYKWESGLSQPELNLIVEMADFFDTSVDVLLGYRMKDNRLDAAIERLITLCQSLDPTALTEAEKTLGRYPHSFRAVYACAQVFMLFGSNWQDPKLLKRAKILFEQSRILLSQNDDPRIDDTTICGALASVLMFLGEKENGLQMLKQNNANGVWNSSIGAVLVGYMNRPEEAEPYISEAFLNSISNLVTAVISYFLIFRSRGEWPAALAIINWGIDCLSGMKPDTKPDILEKIHAELFTILAYAQKKSGQPEAARVSLEQAVTLALRFDSMPDFSLRATRFAKQVYQTVVVDSFGASAVESITNLISLLDDPVFAGEWEEVLNGRK